MTAWLLAFAFTQAVEVPLYWRFTGGLLKVSFLASTFTHPVVWFLFPAGLQLLERALGGSLGKPGYVVMVLLAELFAWLAEAVWLGMNGVRRSLVYSFAANIASFSLGLLSRAVFDVP